MLSTFYTGSWKVYLITLILFAIVTGGCASKYGGHSEEDVRKCFSECQSRNQQCLSKCRENLECQIHCRNSGMSCIGDCQDLEREK